MNKNVNNENRFVLISYRLGIHSFHFYLGYKPKYIFIYVYLKVCFFYYRYSIQADYKIHEVLPFLFSKIILFMLFRMPRNYVAKPGAKRYKKYDDLVIKQALDEIALTKNSLSAVAQKYNISKSVLCRHKNRNMKPHGRPTALSKEEELYIVENLNICGDWGYPLDTTDLRYVIKMYLDSMNISHNIFKNNMPGIDYVNGFLKRHANIISQRICQNIKRSRAAVSPNTLKEYFAELEKSLENVPTQNIINYDETNLTDDPGRKKVIVRRGCKYPERVVNHSKGSISLMMSATADGDFLPPYIVYKSAHLYDSWTTRGPPNARYNRSSSGWFDGEIFEDWVKTIVIPFLQNKDGKKMLIGDNLSSHLSIDVIKLCQEKDIHFIFLPANSTHLTQPLDVAVFRPMKMIWRNLLDKWKKSDDGRLQSCVPKGCFPLMLKLLIDELSVNAEKNIKAGFRKCGIVPLDCNQVLARLPQQEENEEAKITAVSESFYKLLKEMRYGSMNIREPKKKRKLEVVAGRSVSAEEVKKNEDQQETVKPKKMKTQKQPSSSTSKLKSLKGKGVGKKTKQNMDGGKEKPSDMKICEINYININEVPDADKNIIEVPVSDADKNMIAVPVPNAVIPDPFNLSIEAMPIILADNFDCQEIIVKTDDEVQKSEENIEKQEHEKENENIQVRNTQKSGINIISDIKLKLPLPLKKTNNKSSLPKNEISNSIILKRRRTLDFYKDKEEILKVLEEE